MCITRDRNRTVNTARSAGALVAGVLLALELACGALAQAPSVTIREAPPGAPVTSGSPRRAPAAESRTAGYRSTYRSNSTRTRRRRTRRSRTARVQTAPRTAERARTAARPVPRTARRTRAVVARTEPRPSPRRTPAVETRTAGYRSTYRSSGTGTGTRPPRESAVSLNLAGWRLIQQGRYAEAEPLLRRAVRLSPGHAYAQYNLGWSLLAQGKAREALGPLHTTAAQQPGRWEPQSKLAAAYRALGDRRRASNHAERARELRSGSRVGGRPGRSRRGDARVGSATPVAGAESRVSPVAWVGSTNAAEERSFRTIRGSGAPRE